MQNSSSSRCSRASFTAFKLTRAFANAFPFNTFFIQPFVTSRAASMISAYLDSHILWLVRIQMKFISVWNILGITTCLLNLSGKVHINGRAFIQPLDWRCLSYIFRRLLLWLPLTAAIVLDQFRTELLVSVYIFSSQCLFSSLALIEPVDEISPPLDGILWLTLLNNHRQNSKAKYFSKLTSNERVFFGGEMKDLS